MIRIVCKDLLKCTILPSKGILLLELSIAKLVVICKISTVKDNCGRVHLTLPWTLKLSWIVAESKINII